MLRGKNLIFLISVLLVLITAEGCKTQAIRKQNRIEKKLVEEERRRKKAYKALKKQHFQRQTKETQQRMKASQKRQTNYQKSLRK
ncbi:MAG: hypothetical protein WBK40_00315 [Bacteroidales bacterium]|jgi:Na+/phosphate symporter|nr:MAG: hypothetical protein BWX63_00846 [Bacteroidetes bacterium ADurb.Bin041]HPA12147.1 hypothetical protein [Bacteroidales bacterium]HQP54032.1 hypothetical protein [Bacteroidales bacterium]